MRILQRLAAIAGGLSLSLSALAATIDPATYGFPITNPFEATIAGTPPELRPQLPANSAINQRDFSLNLNPQRAKRIPNIFWNVEQLPYRLARQDGPAPLIFIIAGTGVNYSSGKPEFLKQLFYGAGYHVVQLSSPTSFDFITAASSNATPGNSMADAEDLYAVMEAIKARHSDLAVTEYHLTGYSLGALNSAFISQLDETRQTFNFSRVLMINPPVSLLTSVGNLDSLSEVQVRDDGKPPSFDGLFKRLAEFFRERGRMDINDALVFDFQNSPQRLNSNQMAGLIGAAFRFSVTDIVYTSDLINQRGLITPPGTTLNYGTKLVPFFEKAATCDFLCYAQQQLLPLWQESNPDATLEELNQQISLYALQDYLQSSPKIAVMTNADDLILGPGDLTFLRSTFGDRLTVYPLGGHCGNLNYRVNTDAMLEFFRG